jgi:uncharacterized repeat protein (TIGR02543 family)
MHVRGLQSISHCHLSKVNLMRRVVVSVVSLALAIGAISAGPAHAVTDGPVNCGTSGTFTITSNVVTARTSCVGSVFIPEGVTSIAANAFGDATTVTSISVPATVTVIGVGAFERATGLTSITFAPGINLLAFSDYMFRQATSLTSITVPASVQSIGDGTFYLMSAMTSITFAAGSQLQTIAGYAFRDTTALTSITIPATVQTIGDNAFYNNQSLTTVTFASPSALTSIGSNAFNSARALTKIYYYGAVAPATVREGSFADIGPSPKIYIRAAATGFPSVGSLWNGLTVSFLSHEVSYDSKSGSPVSSSEFVDGGSVATAPSAPTRSGFTFAGWSASDGGNEIQFPYSPNVSSAITIFARWTSNVPPVVETPVAPIAAVPAKTLMSVKTAIRFSSGSTELASVSKKAIKKLKKISGSDATFIITGTAGMVPGISKTQVKDLAQLRADSLAAYLIKLGVKKSNITIKVIVAKLGKMPKSTTASSVLVP